MSPEFIVVGGGGFGSEVACWMLNVIEASGKGHVSGYIADGASTPERFPSGVRCIGSIAGFAPRNGQYLLMAIGSPKAKRDIAEALMARGAEFATLVHPTAVVAATARIGKGTILCPHAVVSANAEIDEFVIVNICSSVGHDVRIGSYSTLSAHVDLTGGVVVGSAVSIGSGARVLPGRQVGEGATVGAGAIVMRNVREHTTVYASAAKEL